MPPLLPCRIHKAAGHRLFIRPLRRSQPGKAAQIGILCLPVHFDIAALRLFGQDLSGHVGPVQDSFLIHGGQQDQ